jgi:hypothetical protein
MKVTVYVNKPIKQIHSRSCLRVKLDTTHSILQSKGVLHFLANMNTVMSWLADRTCKNCKQMAYTKRQKLLSNFYEIYI